MKAAALGRLLLFALVMLLVYTFAHTAAGAPVMPVEPPFLEWTVPANGPDPELAQLRHDNARLRTQNHRLAHRVLSLYRTLIHQPSVTEGLNLACVVYGNCQTLWRRAACESHLYAGALNHSSQASGLLQFLPGTWRSTPFGRFNVFSPYANALAAGWMFTHGRINEWSCA